MFTAGGHCYMLRPSHEISSALFWTPSGHVQERKWTTKNTHIYKAAICEAHLNITSTAETQAFGYAVAYRLGALRNPCRIYCCLEHSWYPIITPENFHLFIYSFPRTNLPLHAVGMRVSFVSKFSLPLLWEINTKRVFLPQTCKVSHIACFIQKLLFYFNYILPKQSILLPGSFAGLMGKYLPEVFFISACSFWMPGILIRVLAFIRKWFFGLDNSFIL